MKKYLKFILILFLSAVIIFPLQAQTIEKNNYFTINYNFVLPNRDLRQIVNDRTGKGIAVNWQNYYFENAPLDITFEYNEWGTGKSNFKDWKTSRVIHLKLIIGWLFCFNKKERKGIQTTIGFSFSRWRIEKEGNFYLSTTKFDLDGEIKYITTNNWVISLRGTGDTNLTRDIKVNTLEFSIGKMF
ncbi:hypothetical protein TTHT_2074 [Thermotomaculum hydrothermale]|uniref:Uncharacterized protein n=1 Tax=Thermotomaculum hydrothermale TaxID=981385 RepID=A0A7R6PGU1_9BACT|nr:hypothetical protein [Thermotomaculum hydrothermale]BBB33513.1 hypothetical protein TTHT_2074 [Thermotomaculum hydrothermale]